MNTPKTTTEPTTKTLEHSIPEPWRTHFREVLGQIENHRQNIAQLKGQIYEREQLIEQMARHLGVVVGKLAESEHLPPSVTPYRLSSDGTKILGEVVPEDTTK
jgi:hypothetical protein